MARFLSLALSSLAFGAAFAPDTAAQEQQQPPRKNGLIVNEPGALPGYTMIASLNGSTIYLVDIEGRPVHCWKTGYAPGSEYFMDDGTILRCSKDLTRPVTAKAGSRS